MSNLLAAVGRGQLLALPDRLRRRRSNNEFYRGALSRLAGIGFMPEASYGRSNCWLTCITVDPPESGTTSGQIRESMEAQDIEARPVWKPMHLQPVFAGCRVRGGGVAEDLFVEGLCLPSGSNLGNADRQRVVDAIEALALKM